MRLLSALPLQRLALSGMAVALSMALAGCGSSYSMSTSTPVPTAPVASLTVSNTTVPLSLPFALTTVGTSAGTQLVTLTNTGNATLSGIAVSLSGSGSGSFTETSACGTSLAAGSNCTISVNFTPSSAGLQSATLSVADNASGSPQTVALSGYGQALASACTAPSVRTAPGTTGVAMNVTVLSGLQAVSGATVQLYAAGTSGLGSAPTALLSTAVTSASTGAVTIPATYTFPSLTSQVYLVARGGSVGGVANSGLAMMTALGTGSQIASGSSFVVNEVTTVAATYALSQFMATGGLVGASSTNATGIANAFATAGSLACSSAGSSPGTTFPANGVSPASRIDSLANLLNACAATVSSNACSQFYAATKVAAVAPTNTLDAIFNLARNPGSNVSTLYTLSGSSTVFSPALSSAPGDWTMFVPFTGGGMNSPSGLGIDSLGNVRVANYFNVASAFSPIGAPLYANGVTGLGLDNSYGLAVDATNNAWIPNEQSPGVNGGLGSVSVLNVAGASVAGSTGYTSGGLNFPIAVAIDPNTTAWVVDYGNSHVTLLSSSGTPVSGTSGYTTSLFAFPVAVAVDGNHFGWIANQSSNNVTKVAPDGSTFTNYACCNGASGIAVDQANNIWVANYYGNSISQISSTGTIVAGNGTYTANGNINHPQGIALDGAGHVWLTNFRASYLTELAGSAASTPGAPLSPSPGYAPDANLLEAYALAIDASGNIWVTGFGNDTVTEFVGLAVPVKTPLLGLPTLP